MHLNEDNVENAICKSDEMVNIESRRIKGTYFNKHSSGTAFFVLEITQKGGKRVSSMLEDIDTERFEINLTTYDLKFKFK